MEGADDSELLHQIDELAAKVASNGERITGLEGRADASDARADAADERADDAHLRADALEDRSRIDREMLAELQAEGVVSDQHAAELEQALISSRTIGAAVGILMASRQVSQDAAFTMLREASQRSNRKLRDLAAELVEATSQGTPL